MKRSAMTFATALTGITGEIVTTSLPLTARISLTSIAPVMPVARTQSTTVRVTGDGGVQDSDRRGIAVTFSRIAIVNEESRRCA